MNDRRPAGRGGAAATQAWPDLPWHDWDDTLATLHMWTQVVGKIRLASAPPMNHWWETPLYVTARGLTTSAMPYRDRLFQIDFDFIDHRLLIDDSTGLRAAIDLEPMTVASFYAKVMQALATLDIGVRIWTHPVEVEVAIPFEDDTQHATYEPDHATQLWRGFALAHRLLSDFRGRFIGKASPVHFFWGGFDIAVTRFSGRRAPIHRGSPPNVAEWVNQEAYSHEVSSAGWWPTFSEVGPAFYSYMYPEPAGFKAARVEPEAAGYDADYGEFVLPNEALTHSDSPEHDVAAFLASTYEAGADLAGWDRAALEPGDYPEEPPPHRPWSTRPRDV